MAVINDVKPSLLDLIKSKDPNGQPAKVVQVLTQLTPMLEDIPFREGNLDTGHRITTQTALPTVEWRQINKGYNSSKGKTDQTDEACGLMVGRSEIDVKLVELNGGFAYRTQKDIAFLQSFKHEFETGLVYHSTKTAPEKFMGLAPRFDDTTKDWGKQILKHDASPSGSDQTSIWLVGWGPNSVYGIVPKGTMAGLKSRDLGIQLVGDGASPEKKYPAYVTDWEWHVGLCVEDWRYIVRICNIDATNLSTTGRALIESMMRAEEEKMCALDGNVKPIYYASRTVRSYLRLQATDSVKNSTLTMETVGGKPVLMMDGIPVRRTDAILPTEAIVS